VSRRRTAPVVAVAAVAAVGILLWRLRPDGDAPQAPVAEPPAVARLAAWAPTPPATPLTRVASYVWAAPLSAAGLLLGAASATRPRRHEGALLFTGVRGPTGRMLRWRGFAAATLGHVIVAADDAPTARLLRHELVHVRQAERWGPLFAPLYLAGLLRYGYRRNPFERAAYDTTRASTA
jgi:hypothetical protein